MNEGIPHSLCRIAQRRTTDASEGIPNTGYAAHDVLPNQGLLPGAGELRVQVFVLMGNPVQGVPILDTPASCPTKLQP